jgi:uncharacterized protein YbjT (DUF2867 family)
MSKNIAVIGATGMIGAPVALELAKQGFTVTAMVRDESAARKKLRPEIRIQRGDIKNTGDILHLLSGQDYLYINLNLKPEEKKDDWHAETDGLKNILACAKKLKIKRIGFISSIVMRYQGMNDFNWWVFDLKQAAIRQVREAGIPYTIFYPSTLMENFEGNYRRGKSIALAGESKHKMHFISAIDFGKQVAKAFEIQSPENKEYDIQGLEAYTAKEAAEKFVQHYKKEKLKVSTAPLGLLKFFGVFSAKFNYVSHIIEALNNYPEKFTAESAWNDLGKPTITIRDYAEMTGPAR